MALLGTTREGGPADYGVVWQIANGVENILHTFQGGEDGALPAAEMIQDAAGNLYGTTTAGGGRRGTIYEVTPQGESVLYSFGKFGTTPSSSLVFDSKGRLCGFTALSVNKVVGDGVSIYKVVNRQRFHCVLLAYFTAKKTIEVYHVRKE
jgi:uncharacterized repeat protein (TIGR03803 family)